MSTTISPICQWSTRPVLLALVLLAFGNSRALLAAEDQAAKTPADHTTQTDAAQVDPRFRSPQATVRWFLASVNAGEDDTAHLKDAAACLDMSALPPERREGERLAFELERVLNWLKMPTRLITDQPEGTQFTIGEKPELQVKLTRQPDGRWLFDKDTVAALPSLGVTLYRQASEAPPPKENNEAAGEYQTPQSMLRSYLAAVKSGNLDEAAHALDLSEIPAPARGIIGRELAVKLKAILDRTRFIILQDVPNTSAGEPLEAVVRPEGRIVIERQPTGEHKGKWLFTRATVASIDRLYDAYEPAPIVKELEQLGVTTRAATFRHSRGLWLRERVPGWLKEKIDFTRHTSIRLYQVLGLVLFASLVYPVYRCVIKLSLRLGHHLAVWRNGPEGLVPTAGEAERAEVKVFGGDWEMFAAWARPLAWLIVLSLLVLGIQLLDLDGGPAGMLLSVLMPLYWLVGTLFLYQLVDPAIHFVVGRHATRPGSMTRAAMGFPVISLVLKFMVISLGLSEVLELFSFDVTTVLAGLGIGGLAFALAAQDTLKNFFGSIMLIWDRTFRVGDRVQIGAHEGLIESVGLRTTRIRGLDDSLLTIPNSDLTTEHVTNFGARRFRRFRTTIAVPYGTPLEQVIQFRDGVIQVLARHPAVLSNRYVVVINDLGPWAIEMLVEVFFEAPDERTELQARDALILDILRLSEQYGITPTSRHA
jgi:MscS family membrane protein